MAVKLPQTSSPQGGSDRGMTALEQELKAEQASMLGRYGREVEKALSALREAGDADPALRSERVTDAAQAVWAYFVQREACGLRNHDLAIELYAIPGEVLARVGSGHP